MKLLSTLFLFLYTLTTPAFAADVAVTNAGFVQSNIWYSKDPFYAGEKIRIYTVVFNGSEYDLTGSVEFLDNSVSIGKTNFSISHDGRAQDLWIDWTAKSGTHSITARLVGIVSDGPNGKQSVVLTNAEAGKSERTVTLDPVAQALQDKLTAEKAAETRAQTFSKVQDVITLANNAVPVEIKDKASQGANVIEKFRLGEAYVLEVAKNAQSKAIEEIKAEEKRLADGGKPKTVGSATDAMLNTVQKPFAYVMLALLTVGQFVLEWSIIFYIVSLYLIYKIIKWIVGKIRNRE